MSAPCKIQIVGVNAHKCGYCKSEGDSSKSFGFCSSSMSTEVYESLMLIGWRRCGDYFYRPTNHDTCCPMYTIRLRAAEFTPSKSQKKVLKNAEKYFTGKDLSITLSPAAFSEEKFQLYKRYQIVVHGDEENEVTQTGFQNFLVTSPLTSSINRPGFGPYGTFHQEYRCDGTLFAVGVLDILPSGLSSVYFFYEPDMKHLSLGKYSALQEIQFCNITGFEFYYMGFYIHSCEKMKYKGEYKPSQLLCPTTLTWHYLKDVISKLEVFKFAPLEESAYQQRARMSVSEPSELKQLFPPRPSINDLRRVAIHISRHNVTVRLQDLTPEGQKILGNILLELSDHIPLQVLNQLVISV